MAFDRLRYGVFRAARAAMLPVRQRYPALVNRIDDPRNERLLCRGCGRLVRGRVYHAGVSECDFLYCSFCPNVLVVGSEVDTSDLRARFRERTDDVNGHYDYLGLFAAIEALFGRCECGGVFAFLNPPRCPHCGWGVRGDIYHGVPERKGADRWIFVARRAFAAHEKLLPEERHRLSRLVAPPESADSRPVAPAFSPEIQPALRGAASRPASP